VTGNEKARTAGLFLWLNLAAFPDVAPGDYVIFVNCPLANSQ